MAQQALGRSHDTIEFRRNFGALPLPRVELRRDPAERRPDVLRGGIYRAPATLSCHDSSN
jgi:hypothetical protein